MITSNRVLVVIRACAATWALAGFGCAKPVPPPMAAAPPAPMSARITFVVAADVNPDGRGRPSPVVVRLYELSGDAAFAGADFFRLFDAEEQALGPELISRSEVVLEPAERRTIDLPIAAQARFVGAVAAFRDIRSAEWRVLVPTWSEGARSLTFAIERSRVSANVADASDSEADARTTVIS